MMRTTYDFSSASVKPELFSQEVKLKFLQINFA